MPPKNAAPSGVRIESASFVLPYTHVGSDNRGMLTVEVLDREAGLAPSLEGATADAARFRQANEQALSACFTQVLRLCAAAGLVRVGVVALDGTKIEANASLHANRGLEAIDAEVQAMLAEAAATDRREDELLGKDNRGDELPEGLRSRAGRLHRLKSARPAWRRRT